MRSARTPASARQSRSTAAQLSRRFASGTRGEIVLVVGAGGEPTGAGDLEGAREAVRRLVEAGAKRRSAAQVVASLTGLPTNQLYR